MNIRCIIKGKAVGTAILLSVVMCYGGLNSQPQGYKTIHEAVQKGDLEAVKKYLEKGVEADLKNSYGETPLHIAASYGQRDIADLLIVKGADVNAKDNKQYTPLHNAAVKNQIEIAILLIAKGADINAKDEIGNTPLARAIIYRKKEMAELLIAKGATPVQNSESISRMPDEVRPVVQNLEENDNSLPKTQQFQNCLWGISPEVAVKKLRESLNILITEKFNKNATEREMNKLMGLRQFGIDKLDFQGFPWILTLDFYDNKLEAVSLGNANANLIDEMEILSQIEAKYGKGKGWSAMIQTQVLSGIKKDSDLIDMHWKWKGADKSELSLNSSDLFKSVNWSSPGHYDRWEKRHDEAMKQLKTKW